MDFEQRARERLEVLGVIPSQENRAAKKNYTERVSHALTEVTTEQLHTLGLRRARAPRGRDKQFMGGYGTKGVDVYLSDEKHGLLLSSGTKGLLFNLAKNLKNRYRDMVIEALELHKRFPYAVCGHLLFLSAAEAHRPSKAFGTILQEAVALLTTSTGRKRPDEAPEVYETTGILLLDPADAAAVDLRPVEVPPELHAATYPERLAKAFRVRNPFYND